MPSEPENGIWLAPAQVEALYDWYAGGADALTITDMRSKLVEANALPLLGDTSGARGSVLVEQESDGVGRAAIIDRRGNLHELDYIRPNVQRGDELVAGVSQSLRELRETYEMARAQSQPRLRSQWAALETALDAWDEFEQSITEEGTSHEHHT